MSEFRFSDIDLIVHSKDGRRWESHELDALMSVLRQAFCQHHICTDDAIQLINGATVPIIKLIDRRTDIKVDMSFNMNNGLRNVQLILVCIYFFSSLTMTKKIYHRTFEYDR